MMANILEYPLVDGYIHNWLLAGPLLLPLGGDLLSNRFQACRLHAVDLLGKFEAPVDRNFFSLGEVKLRWEYFRTELDHLVEIFSNCSTRQVSQGFAYTELKSQLPQKVKSVLTTSGGLSDLWINGRLVYQQEHFTGAGLKSFSFPVELVKGTNKILLRLVDVFQSKAAMQMALRLTELVSADLQVVIPTHTARSDRHQRLEEILDYAYLEDVVNYRGKSFNIRWGEGLDEKAHLTFQVQDADGNIYVDGNLDTDSAEPYDAGHGYRLSERPYWVVLRATGAEYYNAELRYLRRLPIHVLDNPFSSTPYGTFSQRQQEALEDASKHEEQLYAQIARMQLAQWEQVKSDVIVSACQRVTRGESGCILELLGLLGMCMRFEREPAFPEAINSSVKTCACQFSYLPRENSNESERFLYLTCQILAGQYYAQETFDGSRNGKQKGSQLYQWAKSEALTCLKHYGARGFEAWDSQYDFELILVALAHLVGLAEDETLCELSAVVMDKCFFTMAINSYRGTYAGSHGATSAVAIKSAQLEATSGIMRMIWGMGVYNHHIAGVVSLACSNYEFPVFIGEIASDTQEMWSHERHALQQGEVNKVTYRTADYLLASAQDYLPGQPGSGEHIWQATFGPEAIVFVNHPACISEDEAFHPGFWRGNAVLPRVAQWKDVLVAVHHLPQDAWLNFTHAYFPIYAFDEYLIDKDWAFARKGNGYLALTAARGLDWVKCAPDGYRELRSYGQQNVWLCHLGRMTQDGNFDVFQRKIRSMKLAWGKLSTKCHTLRGENLAFGWNEPLTVDGQEQPLLGFKHYENPYCMAEFPTDSMDIGYQDILMRLSFM